MSNAGLLYDPSPDVDHMADAALPPIAPDNVSGFPAQTNVSIPALAMAAVLIVRIM